MTQEQKELLLKDLCSRLPYGVKLSYRCNHIHILKAIHKSGLIVIDDTITNITTTTDVENIMPYLFPLSSMNEVQKNIYSIYINELKQSNGIYFEKALNSLQFWLYANHFDVNNLIPMGLAINAVGLNIY